MLHPAAVPEGFLRLYAKEFFVADGPTWQAVLRQKPVAGNDAVASGSLESGAFFRQLMQPQGWAHIAAVRVADPIFKGYPGALHLYRRAGERSFSADELRELGQLADQLSHAIDRVRDSRVRTSCMHKAQWNQSDASRQFIFDGEGKQVSVYHNRMSLDDRLEDSVRHLVSQRLDSINGEAVTSDRAELVDNSGEIWAFRTIVYKRFPALGDGPFVFMCLQPGACEWNAVKPTDFQGDHEIARLIPTLKFMQQEFPRTPTLDDIALKAHLSPFHFHRRFTELLGQTPKHFLLACQVEHAKNRLMERKVPLAVIAEECGFAHQSHFTSRFKQATGLTPTRWRRCATDRDHAEQSS